MDNRHQVRKANMAIKYVWFFVLIILISILLSSCSIIENYQQDPFYKDDGWWDHLRFPLIKPYYAILIKDEYGWSIPLEGSPSDRDFYYYIQINDVQKIAVENGVIMFYTPTIQKVDESVGQKALFWFVVIPDQNAEMGFDQEEDFLTYIQQLGIQDPSWQEPDDILQEYEKTRCLDWIPGCE
jgi:hypothetical protein